MTASKDRTGTGWIWKGGLFVASCLLLMLGITVLYVLWDANSLKPLLSAVSERYLDRSLSIDGELSLDLSLQPTIVAHGVSLGNAHGTSAPHMAQADYLRVQIDLADLWTRRVNLPQLDIRGAVLNLEDTVDGRPNWEFSAPGTDSSDNADAPDPDSGPAWSFTLGGLDIQRSVIHATIGTLQPMVITIPSLVEQSRPDGHMHMDGHGTLNDRPWLVDGQIGPLTELLSAGRIEVDLALTLDNARINASGSIGNLATLSELNFNLKIDGPHADMLGEVFRMPEAFRGDMALDATMRPEGDTHALSIQGHIAAFQVQASGTVRELQNLDGWDGSFAIEGPDADVFGRALQIEGFPDGPFHISGAAHLHGGDLDLKEVQITTADVQVMLNADFVDFPYRKGAVATMSLSGKDLSQFRTLLALSTLAAEPFDLRLALDATGGGILTSSLEVGSHSLTAHGPVGEYPDFLGTQLAVSFSGDAFAEILHIAGTSAPLDGPYQARGRLTRDAAGLTLTQIDARLPPFQLRGELHWPDLTTPASYNLDGALDVQDLAAAAAPFTDYPLPDSPLNVRARIRAHAGGFDVGSSQFTLPDLEGSLNGTIATLTGLRGLDLNLAMKGASVAALYNNALPDDDGPVPFTLRTRIQGSGEGVELSSFRLETDGGTFTANGLISLADGLVSSHLRLNGSGADLSDLVPAFPAYQPPDLPWKIDAEIALPQLAHLSISNARLQIGSVNATLNGILDSADQTRTSLSIKAQGDRISDIGQIGATSWPNYPFSITTELEGSLNAITIKQLDTHWGESDLTGSGSIGLEGKPVVHIQGRSRVLNIVDLKQAIFGLPEDLEPEDDDQRIFPDVPIPTDFLALLDAHLDIKVDAFHGQRTHMRNIDLILDVKDGQLLLERASYRDDIGYFDGKGLLRPEGDSVYVELQTSAKDAAFRVFTTPTQHVDTIPRYSVDVNVTGRGNTVAELLSHLNGTLLVSSDGGQINNRVMNAFGGDFVSNVLEVLNPLVTTEEFTPMQCMVLNAAIHDGQLKLVPGFVMRTDRLNMFVYGSVNLATEKLDLSLATQASRGIGISAATITNPYFKVGGTLSAPALQLDPSSAAVAASLATATAGLSILVRGVLDRLRGTQNPCPTFLAYKQQPVPSAP